MTSVSGPPKRRRRLRLLKCIQSPYRRALVAILKEDRGSFKALHLKGESKNEIRAAVLNALKTIDAYEAWWNIGDAIQKAGYWSAIAVAVIYFLTSLSFMVQEMRLFTRAHFFLLNPIMYLAIASMFIAGVIVLFATVQLTLRLKLTPFKREMIFMLLAGALFYVSTSLISIEPVYFGLRTGLLASMLYLAVLILAIFANRIVAEVATRLKIKLHPEEEIIQSLCLTTAHIQRRMHARRATGNTEEWKSACFREGVIERLEWIARQMELSYATQFSLTDERGRSLRQAAERVAEKLRGLALRIAAPDSHAMYETYMTLRAMLLQTASGDWASLLSTNDPPQSSPRAMDGLNSIKQPMAIVRAALGILFPSIVLTLLFIPGVPSEIWPVRSVAAGWLLLSVIRANDPKNFEAQWQALRSFTPH